MMRQWIPPYVLALGISILGARPPLSAQPSSEPAYPEIINAVGTSLQAMPPRWQTGGTKVLNADNPSDPLHGLEEFYSSFVPYWEGTSELSNRVNQKAKAMPPFAYMFHFAPNFVRQAADESARVPAGAKLAALGHVLNFIATPQERGPLPGLLERMRTGHSDEDREKFKEIDRRLGARMREMTAAFESDPPTIEAPSILELTEEILRPRTGLWAAIQRIDSLGGRGAVFIPCLKTISQRFKSARSIPSPEWGETNLALIGLDDRETIAFIAEWIQRNQTDIEYYPNKFIAALRDNGSPDAVEALRSIRNDAAAQKKFRAKASDALGHLHIP